MARLRFSLALPATPPLTLGDGVILLALAALLYGWGPLEWWVVNDLDHMERILGD